MESQTEGGITKNYFRAQVMLIFANSSFCPTKLGSMNFTRITSVILESVWRQVFSDIHYRSFPNPIKSLKMSFAR